MKNSEIILCKGIKLDKNYENVLSYNEESMVSLCRNNKIYEANNYTFVEKSNNKVWVNCVYSKAMYSNYIAFRNPRFGNKWIFAWVTDVRLLNVDTTEITFEVDVWSTWYSKFEIGKAFIEREHVSDDTVGKHTIPENLETGEYITQLKNHSGQVEDLSNMYYLSEVYLVAGVSDPGMATIVQEKIYSGIYSGLWYLIFDSGQDLSNYIKFSQQEFSADNICTIFIIPRNLVSLSAGDWITASAGASYSSFKYAYMPDSNFDTDMGSFYIYKPQYLDVDYIPTNNKLLTFPYCFINVTNNCGNTKDYHYELFKGNYCNFNIKGAVSVGCSIKLYPIDYDFTSDVSNADNKLHSLDAGKLPTCSWFSDAYTNWLTQNGVNIGLSATKDLMMASVGIATGNVGGLLSGFGGIASTVASVYEHSLQPSSSKGNINGGDLNYARRNTFNIYRMSIKKEYAQYIDRYFSRFGYKVNEIKTPNLKTRTQFNFIKVGGLDEVVHGDIPASDMEKINNIFRKGVTIFHNYSNFGNYTISNPIRS